CSIGKLGDGAGPWKLPPKLPHAESCDRGESMPTRLGVCCRPKNHPGRETRLRPKGDYPGGSTRLTSRVKPVERALKELVRPLRGRLNDANPRAQGGGD